MDNTFFDNYKLLKSKLDYTYKGYNFSGLIPGYLNFVFDGLKPTKKEVIKAFYDSSTVIDLRKVTESKSPVVLSYLIGRADYRNLVLATQAYFPSSEVIDLSNLPEKKVSFLNGSYLKSLFQSIQLIIFRLKGEDLLSKLLLIAICTKIFNQIKLIEKHKSKCEIEKYICFNSAYKEESVLTQYFNKRKIETITLQHGIFCKFKLFVPFDEINFENLQAQKILCWGQSSIDFLTANGFVESRLILLGNLKYKGFRIEHVNQSFKSCLVLLGRGLYVDTNNRLLEVLNQYNQKHALNVIFYVKKHPFLFEEEHRQFANVSNNMIFLGKEHSVEEILKSSMSDFSIAVNTTAYYESLALGKPCLRWTESENEDFYGMDDKFTSLTELEDKIEQLKKESQSTIRTNMQNVIQYVFNPN